MKDRDSRLIYEASKEPLHWSQRVDEIKQKQQDAEIDRVTCHCDDCMFWSAGNKCVAESISLRFGKSDESKTICICDTYTKTE